MPRGGRAVGKFYELVRIDREGLSRRLDFISLVIDNGTVRLLGERCGSRACFGRGLRFRLFGRRGFIRICRGRWFRFRWHVCVGAGRGLCFRGWELIVGETTRHELAYRLSGIDLFKNILHKGDYVWVWEPSSLRRIHAGAAVSTKAGWGYM